MSEFKAQILGVLIVLSVFGILSAAYSGFIQNSIDKATTEVNEILEIED